MKDRLRTCDIWHVGKPARVVMQKSGRNVDGRPKFKSACLECMRLRVAERRIKGAYPNLLPRLTWSVPKV